MNTLKLVSVTPENIANEHICCAFTDKKCSDGYKAKKQWLKEQHKNAYRFWKLDVRGKVLIEYVPAENSWLPVSAPDFMLINCFWVSGQFKGKGNGKLLLDKCFEDSKDMAGVIAITSKKKKPFMTDSKFLKLQGFEKVDEAPPYFELWCKKNNEDAPDPGFFDSARQAKCENTNGITVYYTDTCPFNDYYVNTVLTSFAKKKNLPVEIRKISSKEQGRAMPVPWIIYSVFYEGEFLTHEIKSKKGLEKLFSPLL